MSMTCIKMSMTCHRLLHYHKKSVPTAAYGSLEEQNWGRGQRDVTKHSKINVDAAKCVVNGRKAGKLTIIFFFKT